MHSLPQSGCSFYFSGNGFQNGNYSLAQVFLPSPSHYTLLGFITIAPTPNAAIKNLPAKGHLILPAMGLTILCGLSQGGNLKLPVAKMPQLMTPRCVTPSAPPCIGSG